MIPSVSQATICAHFVFHRNFQISSSKLILAMIKLLKNFNKAFSYKININQTVKSPRLYIIACNSICKENMIEKLVILANFRSRSCIFVKYFFEKPRIASNSLILFDLEAKIERTIWKNITFRTSGQRPSGFKRNHK